MLNNSTIIDSNTWFEVSNDNAFFLQNKGMQDILVTASDSMPTSKENAIIVKPGAKITDEDISGRIWAIASTRTQPIAFSVGGTPNSNSSDIVVEIVNPTKELVASGSNVTINIQGKSFFVQERFAGGQQTLALSASPLDAGTESSILFNTQIKAPFLNEYAMTLSQRVKGITPFIEVVDTDAYDEVFQEFSIVSISQATTTLTVTLNNPFDGSLGYLVDIWGLVDNRFNYANLVVGAISTDKKVVSFYAAEDVSITSLTATPASVVGGKLKCQSLGSNNFAKMRFSGAVVNRATMLSRFNQGLLKTSGALTGTQYVSSGDTLPTYLGATGSVELKPKTRFKIGMNEDTLRFMDSLTDSPSVDTNRYSSTEVKPSFFKNYRNKMRIVNPISIPVPIAKIVSAVKTGTTIATITTNVPHGLTAGVSSILIKGVNRQDSVGFANTGVVLVASIVSSTVFTVVMGTAGTTTSYGGFVVLGNGSSDVAGINSNAFVSAARNSEGIVTVVGGANWSGLNIGEYIDLYGCLGSTGNDLGLDGVYKVNGVVNTTLTLEPVKNLDGTYTVNGLGNPVTPSGAVINTTNCGGAVILRSTMRMHDITSVSYNKQMVQMEGQGINDISLAIPVMCPAILSTRVDNAISATTGLGGVLVNPGNTLITDITSAALTTSTTGSALSNTHGNGYQVTIPVTAVSGTNPTMDIRVEESFDGGTNWVIVYDFQRITATGSYNSPMLRAMGSHIRYVRTISGTTPSFTMSIQRNLKPMIPAEPQKRLIDRSIVLTTLDSVTPILFQGAANNVQLIVSLGAATTPPAIQLEGSEDGVNWYAMGAPLTCVATKTVQLTVNSLSATYTRARVSTIGATVTAGYVAIKAWS